MWVRVRVRVRVPVRVCMRDDGLARMAGRERVRYAGLGSGRSGWGEEDGAEGGRGMGKVEGKGGVGAIVEGRGLGVCLFLV